MNDLKENIKMKLEKKLHKTLQLSKRLLQLSLVGSFIAGILLIAPMANAMQEGSSVLKPHEIKRTITTVRIILKVPGGEFPLVYQKNGTVTGDGTSVGLARFFAPKETGKWWIDGNNLCQQWPSWYNGKQFCFTLQKTSPTSLIWNRDDGKSGTARIVPLG
jgi:hypothetical protein